jgi:cystathionine beta-lyase/cystathionine gamma-synthase
MLLDAGDHVIATEGLYGGTYRVLTRVFENMGTACSFVDTGDPDAVAEGFREDTRAVFVETPSNPRMRITDIAAVAEIAHGRDALVMVDNTFMSPWLQRPLECGADISIHSGTKFLGGHSDLIAGLVATASDSLYRRIKTIQNAVGAVLPPFDSWLLMRGMKTLGVRLARSQDSARKIAQWLAERPDVRQVLYPGIGTLTGDEVHERQADGPGAILSFAVEEDICARTLVESVSVWTLAVSLGAVESIITLPARMTHLPYPTGYRERLGIDDSLVRLSVGIEDPDDLIEDLDEAFGKVAD